MNVHLHRVCPYFNEQDVWLIDFSQEGFNSLVDLGYELCPPCLAVATGPPMIKPNGDDDGRMTWHIHVLLRQRLRHALRGEVYERMLTDGLTEVWRGPSATITIDWNSNWRGGTQTSR